MSVGIVICLHMFAGIDLSEKRKPVTIEFYYKTKCGVDVAHQLARQCPLRQ